VLLHRAKQQHVRIQQQIAAVYTSAGQHKEHHLPTLCTTTNAYCVSNTRLYSMHIVYLIQ
jgi:hypothetical protein